MAPLCGFTNLEGTDRERLREGELVLRVVVGEPGSRETISG
jgi:hypothetical protein